MTLILAACAAPIASPAPTATPAAGPRAPITAANLTDFTRASGQPQLVMFYSPL